MEGIFLEFENENALRLYPFAAGCINSDPESERYIPDSVFVDAAIYPVNPSGTLYLSSISEDGVFSVSDSNGVVMTGTVSGNKVELFDVSSLSRHVGTLIASSGDVLAEFAGRGILREYSVENTAFAASCVFPVVIDGVTTIGMGDSEVVSGNIEFSNKSNDDIRVSSRTLADGRKTLRFDVLPQPSVPDDTSIRRIICVVDGQTPFRIIQDEAMPYNSVILALGGLDGKTLPIDKEDVCAAAHREDSFEMADTCSCNGKCSSELPNKEPLPETYQIIEVFIPPTDERPDGAENAFFLTVPNIPGYGYANPLSITLEDGIVAPKTTDPEVVINGNTAELADGEMLDNVTSKGIVLQVPGLSGGSI